MKHIRLRMSIALMSLLMLFTFCACGASHNATVVHDQATEWINEAFLTEHYTGGIYLDEMDTVTDRDFYPDSRTFIVDSQEDYDEIFRSDAAIEVDFETEMLLVCTFTSHYVRPVVITALRRQGSTLSVILKEKRASSGLALTVGAACAPYQRYVVLRLDKLTVTHVDLTVK